MDYNIFRIITGRMDCDIGYPKISELIEDLIQLEPDVIFLKVRTDIGLLVELKFKNYKCVRGTMFKQKCTMTLLKNDSIKFFSYSEQKLSDRGCHFLITNGYVAGIPIAFVNTQLENKNKYSEQRIEQFKKTLYHFGNVKEWNVVIGGDFSLSDQEISSVHLLKDGWMSCCDRPNIKQRTYSEKNLLKIVLSPDKQEQHRIFFKFTQRTNISPFKYKFFSLGRTSTSKSLNNPSGLILDFRIHLFEKRKIGA